MGTTEFVVAGLLPELARDFTTTEAHAGLAITVFAFGMVLGPPVMPMLTLGMSRRGVLTLALAVYAGAHVVSALITGFAVLLATRFIAAVATGTFWAVAAVVAASLVGAARASTAIGVVVGGGMLSTVIGVPLGAWAGQALGWRGPFWALALGAAVAVVALRRLVPEPTAGPEASGVRAELASLRSGRLWIVLLICAAVNAGVLSVYSFVSPLLAGRAGAAASLVPVALVLFGVGTFLGNLVGGRVGDQRPLATIATTATASLVACLVLVVAGAQIGPALAAFALLGAFGLSANPVLLTLAVRYGGAGATLPSAMATSTFNAGTAVGTALTATLLTGPLGDTSPAIVGLGFGLVVLAALGALARATRPRPAPADVPVAVPATASC
ncbi:MFS transporter [Nocardioides aromaticivorans]|uniref:MFS transporter n=2 Tax=Nocardioides aromaticivorans TaxID=200618 RepID=A0ABX7PSZ2_9ACTN|nr:MFS transporter [Nocardioides aromaticivorans]